MKQALRDGGLWPFLILLLLVSNFGHGPERDELLRFHQMQEALQFLFPHYTAETSDLFKARAPAMLEEMGEKIEGVQGMSAHQQLWRHLQLNHRYPKFGRKVRLCQFMGFQERNVELLGSWSERLFKAELLALENDWLQGKVVQQRIGIGRGHRGQPGAPRCQALEGGASRTPPSSSCWPCASPPTSGS